MASVAGERPRTVHEVELAAGATTVRPLLRQGLFLVLLTPLALRKSDEAGPVGAGAVAGSPAGERGGPACRAGGRWARKDVLAAGPGTRGGAAAAASDLGRCG